MEQRQYLDETGESLTILPENAGLDWT